MKRKLIYILLFVFGVSGGVFFSLSKVRATPPVGPSGGETTPSVYYDEHWKAENAMVTTNSDSTLAWSVFNNFNNDTSPSKKPKMVVTKWVVHGHIHFR